MCPCMVSFLLLLLHRSDRRILVPHTRILASTVLLFLALLTSLVVVIVDKCARAGVDDVVWRSCCVSLCRNSAMSTCRPPGRCSAPCAGRRRRRTHHHRRCTPRLHLRRRKLWAPCRRPPCVASPPLRLRLRPSQKRSSQSLNRRKPGRGQRRCTIIPAKCALFFPSRISSYGSLTPRTVPRTAATLKEASDLHLRAGERVLVTEQTSSDWCASLKPSIPDPKYSSSRILGGLERSTVVVDFSPCHM